MKFLLFKIKTYQQQKIIHQGLKEFFVSNGHNEIHNMKFMKFRMT